MWSHTSCFYSYVWIQWINLEFLVIHSIKKLGKFCTKIDSQFETKNRCRHTAAFFDKTQTLLSIAVWFLFVPFCVHLTWEDFVSKCALVKSRLKNFISNKIQPNDINLNCFTFCYQLFLGTAHIFRSWQYPCCFRRIRLSRVWQYKQSQPSVVA